MSDFVAGFAARHHVADDALARAFAAATDFAPAAPSVPPPPAPRSFAPEAPGPRHFRPADPDSNPTEGWDPFDAVAAQADADFVDPVEAARAVGYAEGLAAARLEMTGAAVRDRALLDAVGRALAQGTHIDRDAMAARLRQTVLMLVRRLVGDTGVSPDLLAGRIDAACDLLADGTESALLRVHPDDVALLDGRLPASVFPVGDAAVERGGFVLESASTIVEDGPSLWLEQLGAAIDAVAVPTTC